MRAESIAIVTGASSGIGRSIALELAWSHGRVIALGRNPTRLADVSAECQKLGAEVTTVALDFGVEANFGSIEALADAAEDSVGALVHCAGEYLRGSLDDVSGERLEWLHRVNVVFGSPTMAKWPLYARQMTFQSNSSKKGPL